MTAWVLPLCVCGILFYGAYKKVDITTVFFAGVKDGVRTVYAILPSLILLLTAIGMLRASGALEQIAEWLAPLFSCLGIPPETAPLALLRPISGSGSLAALEDTLRTYGADSTVGRTAAVMMASTETTLYTVSVYFGAVGIQKSGCAVLCGLLGDLTAILVAAWTVSFWF